MSHEIELSGRSVTVDVARDQQKRYVGLSEKEDLGSDEGMLFVWPTEKEHGLVMRDMNFGLDMVFADASGKVTKVHSAGPDDDGANAFSKYAVELPRGWTQKVGVEKGDRLELNEEGFEKSDTPTEMPETLKDEIAEDFFERADMDVGMFAALADETPDPERERVNAPYNEVEGETPNGMTDMSKKDLFKDLEGVSFYSEINDTEVKIEGVEDDRVRVTNGENEWWERMEDVRDKITDGAWEEKDDPCWDGYEMAGTKEQDGESVPNCVPKSEAAKMNKALNALKNLDFRNSPSEDGRVSKEWIPYVGPQGGEGWQEGGSGEVRYQQDPPGEVHGDYSEDYWSDHEGSDYPESERRPDKPDEGVAVTAFTDEIPDLDIQQSSAEDFVSGVQRKIDADPEMGSFLTAHPPEEMKDHTMLRANGDGLDAGVSVSPDGDVQNLYKNEGPRGTGRKLLEEAVDNGGRTLDCYAGYLNRAYRQHGFREVARQEFNTEFAPDDWNYDKYGQPDVVFMAYDPDAEPERTDNYVSDWGEAKELTRDRAKWDDRGEEMEEKQSEIRIPEDEEAVEELASEDGEEELSEEEQNLALAQARLIGDL